jgi:hypothetical protein
MEKMREAEQATEVGRRWHRRSDLDLRTVAAGDVVRLWTSNSEYELRVTDPSSGRGVIAGGSTFKEPAPVEIVGTSNGVGLPQGSRLISVGSCVLLLHRGSFIRTSSVRSLRVEPAVAAPPPLHS